MFLLEPTKLKYFFSHFGWVSSCENPHFQRCQGSLSWGNAGGLPCRQNLAFWVDCLVMVWCSQSILGQTWYKALNAGFVATESQSLWFSWDHQLVQLDEKRSNRLCISMPTTKKGKSNWFALREFIARDIFQVVERSNSSSESSVAWVSIKKDVSVYPNTSSQGWRRVLLPGPGLRFTEVLFERFKS